MAVPMLDFVNTEALKGDMAKVIVVMGRLGI